jgi:hypothetical protein
MTCQALPETVEPEEIGYLAELNHEGDIKFTWNRKNAKECEAAHEQFDAMKAKGFLIFKVRPFGRKSKKQVERFDPKDGGYVYAEGKTGNREPAEIAHKFDPKADYVATPMVAGG